MDTNEHDYERERMKRTDARTDARTAHGTRLARINRLRRARPDSADRIACRTVERWYGMEHDIESVELADGSTLRYVNRGDTYDETLCQRCGTAAWDTPGPWFLSSWGDEFEQSEREHAEETGEIRCAYCGEWTDGPVSTDGPDGPDGPFPSTLRWEDRLPQCRECGRHPLTGELFPEIDRDVPIGYRGAHGTAHRSTRDELPARQRAENADGVGIGPIRLLVYRTADGGSLCPWCANSDASTRPGTDSQWLIVGADFAEGPELCDHCGDSVILEDSDGADDSDDSKGEA